MASPDEEVLLAQIMDDEHRWNDVDDVIVDGWTKRMLEEGRTICFEDLYNEDVASRANEANLAADTRVVVHGKEKFDKKAILDGFAELRNRLDEVENRVMGVTKGIDIRLKVVEVIVKQLRNEIKKDKEVDEPSELVGVRAYEKEDEDEASKEKDVVEDEGQSSKGNDVVEEEDEAIDENEEVVEDEVRASKEGEDVVGAGSKINKTYTRKRSRKANVGNEKEVEKTQDDGEVASKKAKRTSKRGKKEQGVVIRSPIVTRRRNV